MYLLFAGIVGSTLVVLLVWAGAMVYRLYNPERPRSFTEHPVVKRERATARGERVPVGVRDIREDRRRAWRKRDRQASYVLGKSGGIPEAWHRDLWDRRN